MEASGIAKSFRMDGSAVEVLNGVDLRVAAGESVAIVGPSGVGKSTLLHILGLLDHPTAGLYQFEGRNALVFADRQEADIRLRRIGFVFQFHHLLPEFTARENIMLPALMLGSRAEESGARADHLLQQIGLAARASHRPGELSGGEQQRVALARALVNEPALILADEPTGNLDQHSSQRMQELLWEVLAGSGAALVLVTHNQALAARAGSVWMMRDGRLDAA